MKKAFLTENIAFNHEGKIVSLSISENEKDAPGLRNR